MSRTVILLAIPDTHTQGKILFRGEFFVAVLIMFLKCFVVASWFVFPHVVFLVVLFFFYFFLAAVFSFIFLAYM